MIELMNPWLLLLLPLPWCVHRWCPQARPQQSAALKVPFFSRVQKMEQSGTPSFKRIQQRKYAVYAAWFCLVLAAAGPQWLGAMVNLPQAGREIMLAVDLSGSMQTPDMLLRGMQANRLDVVKDIAEQFIQRRVGDRLGLILFGTRAYLQTPLTFDRTTVNAMLNDATIGLAGPETAIGDAIGLAVKRLQDRPKQNRVLVLLTDGASNSGAVAPLQAAQLAASMGIRIYTIGIGADTLMVPGPFGAQMVNPSTDLDEKTLKGIAETTGGLFFRAKDTQALQEAYHQLDQLEPILSDQMTFRPATPLYPWPLAVALLISIYFVIRKVAPSLLTAATMTEVLD